MPDRSPGGHGVTGPAPTGGGKNRLQEEIDRIQEILLRHYATGAASTDDWLDGALIG
jgi:hypothetical protein